MKESGLRIRLDPQLRADFLRTCQSQDTTAAQVIRAFMRAYIDKNVNAAQRPLFAADDFRVADQLASESQTIKSN